MTPEKESDTAISPICIFPQLLTGKLQKRNIEYKNGAHYHGDICGNRRSGYGHFSWPNGARYEGEFVDNLRHGEGLSCCNCAVFILFILTAWSILSQGTINFCKSPCNVGLCWIHELLTVN